VLWRSKEFTDKAAYSSLVPAEIGGVRQYVLMTGDSVAAVDAKDGKRLWQFPRKGPVAAIPTPIVAENYVFVTSGYSAGCNLLKVTKDGDKFNCEEVYHEDKGKLLLSNHHGGAVLVDGYVYGFSDGEHKRGPARWLCQELKTGKVVWPKDADDGKPGKDESNLGKGSLTCADGRLYCYSENEGTVVLAEVSPEGWKEKGRFTIPEPQKKGSIWPHPVVANGKLYLRDQGLIFCYDVKDPAAP
jgi:outer membrane protein assembly factor BamB